MKKLTSLFIFCFFIVELFAISVTKTHTYASPLSVDGTADYGIALVGVDFVAGTDFPIWDRISSVTVSIRFHKTDGSCGSPSAGNAYHGETTYRIDSPSGKNVILANDDTWTGGADAPTVTVTFSASGGATPTGTPTDGTFLPKGGDLNDFVNDFPDGTWTLKAGDDAGADPLCIYSYSVTINTFTPLPIELLSFNAELDLSQNKTSLTWETASEINNDYFTIERSINGVDWDLITMVNGAGFSISNIEYSNVDNNPIKGISYYRLKQTDFDGFSTYSDIKSINNSNNNIFITRSLNQLTVNNILEPTQIRVYNAFGQLIKSIDSFNNSNVTIDNLTSGIYFVKIKENETIKVVI